LHLISFGIDTLRADHPGCYGYHRNTFSNINNGAIKHEPRGALPGTWQFEQTARSP
jgi:hypothetical protein